MNWTALWINLFHTTTYLSLNMGFWVSLAIVAIIVLLMNIVFWSLKPLPKKSQQEISQPAAARLPSKPAKKIGRAVRAR